MIITCECQPCEKLHAYIRGRVLSSHLHQPVVLAAILLGNEIVSYTDGNGKFFFELTTVEGGVNLLIQEVRHRPIEVEVNLQTSLTPNVAVTMEYIGDMVSVDKMQLGFNAELGNAETSQETGITASITVPPRSLLSQHHEVYVGPGLVLHSLYHMDSTPDFTSSAIQSMVYHDSKEVDFSIQSHVSGSLRVVGETGESLSFKQGASAHLSVAIRFDVFVERSQVEGLHIFTYPDGGSHWVDNGKVTIASVERFQYETWVTLEAKLRDINLLWAIGFPARITCYIKSKVSHLLTKQELVGLSVQLEQSMINLDRPSFYLTSAKSAPGEGVCLKAVCDLGGLLYIRDTVVGEEVSRMALTPSTDHGVIMGDSDQVMFYNVDKNLVTSDHSTPYYWTEGECIVSTGVKSGYFEFLVNMSLPKLSSVPSLMPPVVSDAPPAHPRENAEYCYLKVGVYDCLQHTSIQSLSYSSTNHTRLLSMSVETLPLTEAGYQDRDKCMETNVMHQRSACMLHACDSDMHVSVTTAEGRQGGVTHDQKSCRYWSSHSGLTNHMHLVDTMTSFHVKDPGPSVSGVGFYRSFSKELGKLQCQAGDVNKPAEVMDHRNGVAVTFIC